MELYKQPEGPPRDEYALAAMKLGIFAIRQASGVIDSSAVRHEGEKLVQSVGQVLSEQSTRMLTTLAESLKRYFDPADGALPQRLERLLKKDGELEALLARHLDGDACAIAQTLGRHVGEQSPILRMLSPTQNDGILAALTTTIGSALQAQRDHILRQFSLDDKESALSRLVDELSGANGKLKDELSRDLAEVRKEFSLDSDESALSRLVRRVEQAQRTITAEFSTDNEQSALTRLSKLLHNTNSTVAASLTLDDEKSPLSRLRNELLKVIHEMSESNAKFQTEVYAAVAAFTARRQEADRSTRHGGEFEEAVGALLQDEAQRMGDIFEATGAKTGSKAYRKTGDHVITLGAESAAPGARIVCEAKAKKTCAFPAALAEIKEARENRSAQAGIFVFSRLTAPAGIEPLTRQGADVLVVWDRDDVATDILLKAAFWIARALVVRERVAAQQSAADFAEIDAALVAITDAANGLAEIKTWANTVQSSGEKISKKVDKMRAIFEEQMECLRQHIDSLRPSAATAVAA